MKTITTVLFLFSLVAPVASQAHKSAKPSVPSSQLSAAEAYGKEINHFIKQNSNSKRIFANVASVTENAPDDWRELKSEEELDSAGAGGSLTEYAFVWLRNGKVICANFTFQRPSRDWEQYAMYYFREDGTLVMTNETFNTFYANISVEKEKVYGPKGKLLHSWTRYFDLRTGQRKKPNGFASVRAPAYRRVKSLPFYELLYRVVY